MKAVLCYVVAFFGMFGLSYIAMEGLNICLQLGSYFIR